MELSLDPAADQPILTALRTGQHRRAARLMAAHYLPAVHSACRLLTDGERADDLTHESFARAFGSLREFRADGSPLSWLLGIAARCCADHVRQLAAAGAVAAAGAQLAAGAERSPDCAVDGDACREAFGRLAPPWRAALGLVAGGLFPPAAAAQLLGLDQDTFRRLLLRALDELAAQLAPPGAERVAGGALDDAESAYPLLLEALRLLRWRPGAALQRRLDVLVAAL